MSYCRWSDDNMQSDVYVYEACVDDGDEDSSIRPFIIHVKASHPINTEILGEDVETLAKRFLIDTYDPTTYSLALEKRHWLMKNLKYVPINPKHADKTYWADSLEELYEKLESLHNDGLHIPKNVFRMIDEELIAEVIYDK